MTYSVLIGRLTTLTHSVSSMNNVASEMIGHENQTKD